MVQGSASAPGVARAFAVVVAMAVLSGCGYSSRGSGVGASVHSADGGVPAHSPVCLAAAADEVARAANVADGAVSALAGTGNNAQPQCRFSARSSTGTRVGIVANLDSSPQPYQRLERTIVEDGQQFGLVRSFTAPQSVPRLGLDAAWLPDESRLLTTDGSKLISVGVSWHGAGGRRRLALAELVARRYLGTPGRQAAHRTGGRLAPTDRPGLAATLTQRCRCPCNSASCSLS